ncbi:hypothetical protein X762_27390 [Mesorhizobium sp. LSHC426A00]|nr:hypothetical protein X770_27165 [Mesorhizobium sp. LSJC269B00]ESX08707.1 hypothetical protein X768_21725 [Mesorhizobium sp. LSJC265A00]ESX45166.1 hypothetical protein X762_27390 [Mesorhizobium sp. LSHC426A00]ESX51524.1 hypothetical protein X761_25135 [Mesorhizobium sp. LSHC424B00]
MMMRVTGADEAVILPLPRGVWNIAVQSVKRTIWAFYIVPAVEMHDVSIDRDRPQTFHY